MAKMNPAIPVVVGLLAVLVLFGIAGAALYKEPVVMAHHVGKGDLVTVTCVTYYENGTVALQTGDAPFSFVVGEKQVISGIEDNVVGMAVGETKTFVVAPEDAFGAVSEQLIRSVSVEDIKTLLGSVPDVGSETPIGIIKDVTATAVIIDGNHVLAGKTVRIEVTVHSVDGAEAEH